MVIEADQTATDCWFRVIAQASCSDNDNTNDIRAFVRYDTNSTADLRITVWKQTDACAEVNDSALGPRVLHSVVDPALGIECSLSVSVKASST